jgi:DNA repair exonuclease SbcCD ATPase subunit
VLGKEWQPLLTLARADMPDVQYAPQLVRWCQSLDDHSWSRFHNAWNELNQLDTQLASDPAAEAKRAENIQQAREVLSSLEQDEQRLITAIAPFTAATDPTWLEDRLAASRDAQAQIAELARQLQSLPDIDLLAKQLEQAEHELARSSDALAPLLTQFGQDVSRIFEAMAERDQLFDQAARLQSDAAALLVESGFNSLEELAHEAGKAEGLVGTIREESQQLIARAPELWQAVDAPSELVTQQLEELETRNRALQTTIDAAERERAELVAAIRQLEADPSSDAASIETELALLRDEKAELERTRDAIAAEFQEANRLLRELEQVERTALEGRITAYFADFSRTPGRRVELNEDLQVHVRNEDGVRYQPSQLSHGARDQLYLAVYLATTAGLDLPFILDDPFVNCDSERLQAIRACWDRLAPDHQLILLSHSPELAGWAPSLEMREAA